MQLFDNSEIIRLLPLVFALSCSYAHSVSAQKPIEIMQPQLPFDAHLASLQLEPGIAQLTGAAFYEGRTLIGIKSEQTVFAREGSVVSLYPLTPYLEEYLRLKQKDKEGKRMAAISPEAASYRIECKVLNDRGEFTFRSLKPGRYYLQANVHFPSGIGAQEVSAVVEITAASEYAKCTLNKVYRGFLY